MASSLHPGTFGNQSDNIFKTRVLRQGLYGKSHGDSGHCFRSGLTPSWLGTEAGRKQISSPHLRPFHRSESEASLYSWPSRRSPGAGPGGQGAPSQTTCLKRLRQLGLVDNNLKLVRRLDSGFSEDAACNEVGSGGYHEAEVFLLRRGGGSAKSSASSGPSRRRRQPVLPHNLAADDPSLIDFLEEPDDARVKLPAHRIGDAIPAVEAPLMSSLERLSSAGGRSPKAPSLQNSNNGGPAGHRALKTTPPDLCVAASGVFNLRSRANGAAGSSPGGSLGGDGRSDKKGGSPKGVGHSASRRPAGPAHHRGAATGFAEAVSGRAAAGGLSSAPSPTASFEGLQEEHGDGEGRPSESRTLLPEEDEEEEKKDEEENAEEHQHPEEDEDAAQQ